MLTSNAPQALPARRLQRALARAVMVAAVTVASPVVVGADLGSRPAVHFVYLVPSDKTANPAYASAVERAALDYQAWLGNQLSGKTIQLTSPVVTTVQTTHPVSYYQAAGEGVSYWFRAADDGLALVGGRYADPSAVWVFYLDVQNGCRQMGGGGLGSVALMSEDDLKGLLTGAPYDRCGVYAPHQPARWVGGLAHELGHALGLPHPPGCDAGTDTCDSRALMWFGYTTYPATYLRDDEQALLRLSPFISSEAYKQDADADGLPDVWESLHGLGSTSAAGPDGASGDPDGDGATNVEELAAGSHPRGFTRRYLAEGATIGTFATKLAIANPADTAASYVLRFTKSDASVITRTLSIGPLARATIGTGTVPGLEHAEFSTAFESDAPLVLDRTMTWGGSAYGASAETAVPSPSDLWYLAKGSTLGGLQLFYLLQNPNPTPTLATVTYLRPTGDVVSKQYQLPPSSRTTIWLNEEEFAGLGRILAHTDVSAEVRVVDGGSIVVERALYCDRPTQPFAAGHASAGITSRSTRWFFAEGATGPMFDTFVLLANPDTRTVEVEAVFQLPDGQTVTKSYSVAPLSRFNIWLDREDPLLADTAVSTVVQSTNGVSFVAERAMWWPGSFGQWYEAHNSAGVTEAGSAWALAEGEVGRELSTETYILIANVGLEPAAVTVRLLFEDRLSVAKTYTVAAHSRFNVDVRSEFPDAWYRRLGATVEGPPNSLLVVERAMYWNAGTETWSAGTNAVATRVR